MSIFAKGLKISKLLRRPVNISLFGPPKARVVIFDKLYLDEITSLVAGESVSVFDPRYETRLFLSAFVKGLLNWVLAGFSLSLTHHYFVSFLKSSKPDLVLTAVDISDTFYSARQSVASWSNSRFVVFQMGVRWISDMNSRGALLPRDTFFCMTEDYVEPWREKVGSPKFFASGTLLSKVQARKFSGAPRTRSAGFISNWRSEDHVYRVTGVTHAVYYQPEIASLKLLLAALIEMNYSLEIIGSRLGSESEDEYEFYASLLGPSGWSFSARSDTKETYRKLSRYSVLFVTGTTMAYEALSLLKRIMFLNMQSVGNLRQEPGYPNHSNRKSSLLLLKEGEEGQWKTQIETLIQMSAEEYSGLAESWVGSMAIQASDTVFIDRITTLLDQDSE